VRPDTRRGFDVRLLEAAVAGERQLEVRVHEDAPQFEGHFPGHPVLPAVAQLCDLILPEIELAWPDLPALTGSPRMKFARVIRPGERLTLGLWRESSRVRFELAHRDGPCASGTLVFGTTP
jgi:3-hydroxymyristoyl/3-hydroxydecanoyl-(acyl carrier protein) dehydratase